MNGLIACLWTILSQHDGFIALFFLKISMFPENFLLYTFWMKKKCYICRLKNANKNSLTFLILGGNKQ
jgi:hypothetical protein